MPREPSGPWRRNEVGVVEARRSSDPTRYAKIFDPSAWPEGPEAGADIATAIAALPMALRVLERAHEFIGGYKPLPQAIGLTCDIEDALQQLHACATPVAAMTRDEAYAQVQGEIRGVLELLDREARPTAERLRVEEPAEHRYRCREAWAAFDQLLKSMRRTRTTTGRVIDPRYPGS